MSIAVTCPECGHPFQVAGPELPAAIECLLCGTCFPRPAAPAPRPRPAPPVQPAPASPARAKRQKPATAPPAPAPETPGTPSPPTADGDLPIPLTAGGWPALEKPAAEPQPRRGAGAARPQGPAEPDPDDDGTPYVFADRDARRCPNCTLVAKAGQQTCSRCGVDLETGQAPPRVYEPVERDWHAGLPLARRVRLFAIAQIVVIPLGILGAWWSGSLFLFLGPWLLFSGLLAFLLGTFDAVHLSRNKRGQVRLTKTWRAFFRPCAPETYRLADYEGLVTGQTHEVDFWDYLAAVLLLPFGIVPGVLWWLYAMQKISFFVALGKDHGYPAVMLYKGWDENLMKDMARTIREAGECP
jgi:hypothetical protein